MLSYLETYEILIINTEVFGMGQTMNTAIFELLYIVLKAMGKSKSVIALFLALTKALDFVNHKNLRQSYKSC